MEISKKSWDKYTKMQEQIRKTAAQKMSEWIAANGIENRQAMIEFANALTTKYGEAAGAYACQLFDEIALNAGINSAALPAEVATYDEVGKAVNGSLKQSPTGKLVPQVVERLTKQAGADTMLKNARKYGAEWAWIPDGGSCVFCMTLASRGWQHLSKSLQNNHAEHIHANCNCEFAIRFSPNDNVAGYDPDKYLEEYNKYNGDLKAWRNELREFEKEKINEQKRANYALSHDLLGGNVHLKTGNMTTEEYINSKDPLKNFIPVEPSQAVPIARQESNKWIATLDDKAKTLINRYTYNQNDKAPKFYERINSFIRNGYVGEKDYTEQVNIISEALKKSKLENNYQCFRGSDYNPFEGMAVGERKTVDQFFSTSLRPDGAFKGNYEIIVFAGKGTNAGYIEKLSDKQFQKQREMLFDKDVVYELIYSQGKTIIVRSVP